MLSLRLVHCLAELHHDGWLAGAGSTTCSQTLMLLEMLRRLIYVRGSRMGAGSGPSRPDHAGHPVSAWPWLH